MHMLRFHRAAACFRSNAVCYKTLSPSEDEALGRSDATLKFAGAFVAWRSLHGGVTLENFRNIIFLGGCGGEVVEGIVSDSSR